MPFIKYNVGSKRRTPRATHDNEIDAHTINFVLILLPLNNDLGTHFLGSQRLLSSDCAPTRPKKSPLYNNTIKTSLSSYEIAFYHHLNRVKSFCNEKMVLRAPLMSDNDIARARL